MATSDDTLLRQRLPVALAILRITMGVFFLIWALEKFVAPDVTANVWQTFYGISIGTGLSYILGAINTVLALALIAGFMRTITYGFWTIAHAISVIVTWEQLIQPFGGPNHLFLAGLPVLAGMVALFMLRDWDNLYSLDARRAAAGPAPAAERPAAPGGEVGGGTGTGAAGPGASGPGGGSIS